MRIEKVNPGPTFMTFCCKCNRRLYSNRDPIWADLDGEAFKDYYCELDKQIVTGELKEKANG